MLLKAGGADVIMATSNSYKAIANSIKGLRPEGRVILMGYSTMNYRTTCNTSRNYLVPTCSHNRFYTK